MATLRDKLSAALEAQTSEVARLAEVAKVDLPKAIAVQRQLTQLLAQLDQNPDVEQGYAALKALNIKLDTE